MSISESERRARAYLAFRQEEKTKENVPVIVYLAILAVIGLVGNVLVLVVYAKKFNRTPVAVFIMSIAVFDLIANVIATPAEIYYLMHYLDFHNPNLCRFRVFSSVFTSVSAATILLGVAVIRFRKVCRPFGWQVTIPQAKKICGAIAVFSCLAAIPYSAVFGNRKFTIWGIVAYRCDVDDSILSTNWPLIGIGFYGVLFISLFSPLVVLNILIWLQAWRHRKVYLREGVTASPEGDAHPAAGISHAGSSDTTDRSNNESSSTSNQRINMRNAASSESSILEDQHITSGTGMGGASDQLATTDVDKEANLNAPEDIASDIKRAINASPDCPGIATDKNASLETAKIPAIIISRAEETGNLHKSTHGKTEKPISQEKDADNSLLGKIQSKMPVLRKKEKRSPEAKVVGKPSQTQRDMGRTTAVLSTVTIVFILSFLPHIISTICILVFPRWIARGGKTGLLMYEFLLRSYFLNSAVNPFIYSFWNKRFRDQCLALLRCRRPCKGK